MATVLLVTLEIGQGDLVLGQNLIKHEDLLGIGLALRGKLVQLAALGL